MGVCHLVSYMVSTTVRSCLKKSAILLQYTHWLLYCIVTIGYFQVLIPERLIKTRELLGLNKADAARLLNLSKMGYGRYESGERSPSFQTIVFIAQKFGTTVEYLTGKTDIHEPQIITIDRDSEPDLFDLASAFRRGDPSFQKRILKYYQELQKITVKPLCV